MPSTIARLQALFQGRHPEQPADLHPDFKVELPDTEEEPEIDKSSPYVHAHLAGHVFGIEYTTPRGTLGRRWITIEGFKKSKAGDWLVYAYCFAHKGIRSFALDSIQALFDAQGEPVDPSEIFPNGGDGAPVTAAFANTSGKAIIDTCHDGLRALAALAKIDGKLDQSEIQAIVKYAETSSKSAGITMTPDDNTAIERYIRNLQPTGDVVASCLTRISESELTAQEEFFWYAREVMDADGLQDEAEVAMILEISETLNKEL